MPILNYTTQIDFHKTIQEINQILYVHGVKRIITESDEQGNPSQLVFTLVLNGQTIGYQLPCNFEGVLAAMKKNKKVPARLCNKEQALRVGWRILKDWVAAQMAIVDANVSQLAEVFLPYAITRTGKTLFNYLQNDNTLLLTQ